jgi:transaldolase
MIEVSDGRWWPVAPRDQVADLLLADLVAACGTATVPQQERALESVPLLAALARAGTEHVYADTADADELEPVMVQAGGVLAREIDGNTVNQPLVGQVTERYLADGRFRICRDHLVTAGIRLGADILPWVYAAMCGWIGTDMAARYGAGRPWETSLQLHMGVSEDAAAARSAGRLLRAMAPACLVKVPFTPHAPHCFLVARDLEREGIPVNFTSTFSARQAVAAALLADVTRTNIFMGRLNQGLQAERVGEQVDLDAQRALRTLRTRAGTKTRLIVASIRDSDSLEHVAGCDVFTAPCHVLAKFLRQGEPDRLVSRLETSYADRLQIAAPVRERLGLPAIARLWRVESELVEFLLETRGRPEYATADGEWLRRRFDEAGFGDLFHDPSASEWRQIRQSELPDLTSPLVRRLPLDTLYTLLAHADFVKNQEAIDVRIAAALKQGGEGRRTTSRS